MTAEPEVAGLTFADRLPGTLHPRWWIEMDGAESPTTAGRTSRVVCLCRVELLRCRRRAASWRAARSWLPMSQSDSCLGDSEPVVGHSGVGRTESSRPADSPRSCGRHEQAGPWLEIVGMVRDLGMLEEPAGLYRPIMPEGRPSSGSPSASADSPESFAARLRVVASGVEPRLQIHDLMPLDRGGRRARGSSLSICRACWRS